MPASSAPSWPLAAVLAGLLAAATAADASLILGERWREITAGQQVQKRGMAAGDFDDDGRPDLAIAASGPAIILRIEGSGPDGWRSKQTLVAPGSDLYESKVPVAWPVAGPDRLLLLTAAGHAIEYGGWPLAETRRFPIPLRVTAGAIGDIDADGTAELVVTADNLVAAYSLATGTQEWSAAHDASEAKLAQLDADAALEIVLATTPGIVLDGATRAVDWSYPDGFGDYVAVGRFGADATPWFAAARDWGNILVFRTAPWSPVWDFQNFDNDAIDACDAGGDAREEIIVGDGQWGDVLVIDAATHAQRLAIPHQESGTLGLAARDFDGDGDCDIAYAGYSYSAFGASHLYHVYDAASGDTLRKVANFAGAAEALALADLDGNGSNELLVATASEPARLRVAESATGRVLWELAPPGGNANEPFYMKARRVLVGQADGDAAPEIVLVGTSLYDGRVTVIDSATRLVQRQIGTYAAGPMQSREVQDAALLDYDRDGNLDVVVATSPATSGASGSKLHVFSLQSGATLWESVAMGAGFTSMQGVLVAQADADPAAELIAVLDDGLRAYDADSKLLEWSFPYPGQISAFALDPVNQELVLANGIVANFYALSTRQSLRSANLGGAVSGLAWLPGPDRRYVARAGQELVVFDGLSGSVLDDSDWLGPTLDGARPAVAATGSQWQVASSGTLGYFLHAVGPDPMTVFRSGFEP